MNKKYLFSISILISLLIILIPIAVAKELDTYDNVILKTKEQRINLYQSSEEEVVTTTAEKEPFEREYLSDPGKACVSQHEQTSSFADNLDSSTIATLEKIAYVLFAICTTVTAIDTIISTVALAIGMITGGCCPGAPEPTSVARCAAMEGKYRIVSLTFPILEVLCCFVNCGWCTGAEGCFGIFGINLKSISLGAIPNLKIGGPGEGIGQFGLSPYDNIYTAIGCFCPIAIIFNLRKLKTVYDVYDCCIQEACENGLSTEACELQLDEATCMYWEGSLYSVLAKILIGILTKIVTNIVTKTFVENWMKIVLACLYAVAKLARIPTVISNVKSAWEYMGRTFDKPNCKDLGFDRVKEQSEAAMREAAKEGFEDVDESLLENWEYVTMVDANNDGIYDYSAPKWTETSTEGVDTTTIVTWDTKKKESTTTQYWKKEGIIYSDEKLSNKVNLVKWLEIKGENEPLYIIMGSDGSATIKYGSTGYYESYDSFEIKDNEVTFTRTKDDGTTTTQTLNLVTLGDTKIPGTEFKFSDFDEIKDSSLTAEEEGKEGYKKVTISISDGTRTITLEETDENKKTTINKINFNAETGTLKSIKSDLEGGGIIESSFDDAGELTKSMLIINNIKYSLEIDSNNNYLLYTDNMMQKNIRYNTETEILQISIGGKWYDYDSATEAAKLDLMKFLGLTKNIEVQYLEASLEGIEEEIKKQQTTAEKESQEKKAEDTRTLAQKKAEKEAEFNIMYSMVWDLFNFALGETVNDFVEDKCKEDAEKSYPPSDTPTEGGGPASCEDNSTNIYNGQFISKTQLDSTCQYKITYALAACNHQIDFTVQFQGTGSNENIEGGTLALGQILSRNRIITSSLCTHQRICIIIKGEDTAKCFPPINTEGGPI